jgi:hypothetical protein
LQRCVEAELRESTDAMHTYPLSPLMLLGHGKGIIFESIYCSSFG